MTEKAQKKFDVWSNLTKVINPALLLTIALIVWNSSSRIKEIETNSFDSIQDKIDTKNLVRDSFTETERYLIMQHVQQNIPDVVLQKYVTESKFDSVMQLNAVTIFQIKTSIKNIETSINKLNK